MPCISARCDTNVFRKQLLKVPSVYPEESGTIIFSFSSGQIAILSGENTKEQVWMYLVSTSSMLGGMTVLLAGYNRDSPETLLCLHRDVLSLNTPFPLFILSY